MFKIFNIFLFCVFKLTKISYRIDSINLKFLKQVAYASYYILKVLGLFLGTKVSKSDNNWSWFSLNLEEISLDKFDNYVVNNIVLRLFKTSKKLNRRYTMNTFVNYKFYPFKTHFLEYFNWIYFLKFWSLCFTILSITQIIFFNYK